MKYNRTRDWLLKQNELINNLDQNIFGIWHSSRINEFRRLNGISVQTTANKANDILWKYYEKDEATGQPKKVKDESGKLVAVLKEDMTEQGFIDERKAYLEEIITVTV